MRTYRGWQAAGEDGAKAGEGDVRDHNNGCVHARLGFTLRGSSVMISKCTPTRLENAWGLGWSNLVLGAEGLRREIHLRDDGRGGARVESAFFRTSIIHHLAREHRHGMSKTVGMGVGGRGRCRKGGGTQDCS